MTHCFQIHRTKQMITQLTLMNVSSQRGKRLLFEGVSSSIASGEQLQVQGPNGSGKSTLLATIVGLLSPTSGDITVVDCGVTRRLLPGDVVYCGHLNGLNPNMTVLEQIEFHRILMCFEKPVDIQDLLNVWGLLDHQHHLVNALSAGLKQRLSLMRLSLSSAKIWVLDEPYSNLDHSGKALLGSFVANHLAREGLIVVATHRTMPSCQQLLLVG